MQAVSSTRMSSKGQVIIPELIRKTLSIPSGAQFIVLGENDEVVLKMISPPSSKEFDAVIKKARSQAKEANLKPDDVLDAVEQIRKSR